MTNRSMKFVGLALTLAALALLSASIRLERMSSIALASSNTEETIAITGATLIDGTGHAPVKDAVVIIKGGSIVAVGKLGRIRIPPDAKLIDARGFILAP